MQLFQDVIIMLTLIGGRAGSRQLRLAEDPWITRHTRRAAVAIIDVYDRISVPDPIGLCELVDGSYTADGETRFAYLRLELFEAVESCTRRPCLRQEWRQILTTQLAVA
ncbi:hypothetical protein [Bradyrhizobium sp. USDA 4454]